MVHKMADTLALNVSWSAAKHGAPKKQKTKKKILPYNPVSLIDDRGAIPFHSTKESCIDATSFKASVN